jgi:hypothetical protein
MAKEYLLPTSVAVDSSGAFTLVGAATKWEAVAKPLASPNDASYIWPNASGVEISFEFANTSINITSATVINYIVAHYRAGAAGFTYTGQEHRCFVGTSGAGRYGAWRASTGIAQEADTFGTDPSDGLIWTKTKLDALTAGFGFQDLSSPVDTDRFAQLVIEIDYVATAALLGAARDAGSRHLNSRRRPASFITARLPLHHLDSDLLTYSAWSHQEGPTASSEGWGDKTWERRLGLRTSITLDLNNLDLKVVDLDVRDILTLDWDTMISEEPPGAQSPGIPRLNPGAGRLYIRTGDAWVESAAATAQGSTLLVKVPADVEKNAADGELVEGAATNIILNPAFASGVGTNWTTTAGAADATDVITEAGDSVQSNKITRVGTGTARTVQGSLSLTASTAYYLSIYHRDDSAVKLQVQIVRASDGFFWQTGSTWTAGTQTHDLAVRATPDRDYVGPIIKDGATGNVTLNIIAESGSGQVNHIYHVQLEANRWPSSPILVGAGTRSADSLRLANDDGKRVVPTAQGTIFLRGIPNWNSADLASGTRKVLYDAYFDASNWVRAEYDKDSGAFRFQHRVAATTYSATFAATVTRGALYKFAFRKAGVEGELNLTAHTLSIFVNGVKGTDAVAAAFGTLPSSVYLNIGHETGAVNHWDGYLQHRRASPFVMSDAEIQGEHA